MKCYLFFFFFFSSRRRHTRLQGDWSSDVCSSDLRPTWREVQPQPGRLQLPDYVKLVFDLAKKNNKRVGLRIQMSAPDYKHQPALPDFVLDKVPTVELVPDEKEKKAAARFMENQYSSYQPR